MKKWKKKLVAGVFVTVAGLMLASCGNLTGDSKKEEKKNSADGGESILMYRVGDKPSNFDDLMGVVNKKMKDELGVTINMQYIGWGDYEKKMSVITSSGEDYDIAFVNNNYVNNAQKGAYADITELAPKFAKETYENLEPSYIEGNLVDGKLYAIAVNANASAETVATFDKSLVDKYDLDISNVKDLKDFEPLLKVIKEKEPTIDPIATGPGYRVGKRAFDYVFDVTIPIGIDLEGDTAKIINPYVDSKSMISDLKVMHDYYKAGYVPQDAATSNKNYVMTDTNWFVRLETQGPFDYGDTLLTKAASRPLVSMPISLSVKNNAQARVANFAISSTSKKKEKALEVINLINTDSELLSTMVYGMEGENWERVGDDHMKYSDDFDPSKIIGGGWSVGDNSKLFVSEEITDEQLQERDKKLADAIESPMLGFSFGTDEIKTEISNITNVTNQYLPGLHTGTLDPEVALTEFNAKLKEAGIDKVMASVQKQYDEFLAESK